VDNSVSFASTARVIFPEEGLLSAIVTGAVATTSPVRAVATLVSTLPSIAPVVAALELLLTQVSELPRKAPRSGSVPVPEVKEAYLSSNS